MMKLKWFFISMILAGILAGVAIISTHDSDSGVIYTPQGSTDTISLGTTFPNSPATAPVYRVIAKDSIFEGSPKEMDIKASIPSESEAIPLAEKALEKYGGLPKDAVLSKVEQVSIKKYNLSSGLIEAQYPRSTQVIYMQIVNGSPVIGPGAEINIELGENGELLHIEKAWRDLEYDREVPIISAAEGFEKLKKGDLLEIPQSSLGGLVISEIRLGYYAEHREKDQKAYAPVWIFYGTYSQSSNTRPYPYPVNAMK
jgi:hypothetical protein